MKSPSSLAILAFTALACAKGGQTMEGCHEDFTEDCETLDALATIINTVEPYTPPQEICQMATEFQRAVFKVFTNHEWEVSDDYRAGFFGIQQDHEIFSPVYIPTSDGLHDIPGMQCVLYTGGDREQGFTCVLRSGASDHVPNIWMSGYTGSGGVLSADFCRDDMREECVRIHFLPSHFHNPQRPFSIDAYVFGDQMSGLRQVLCPDSYLNYDQLEQGARRTAEFVERMVRP